MNERRPQPSPAFSEHQTKQILARAAELDRILAGRLSPAAIREAALEAGISEDAIEQAIAEATSIVAGSGGPRSWGWKAGGRLGWWLRVGSVGAIGMAAGFFARAFGGPPWFAMGEPTMIAALWLSLVSVTLAWDNRKNGDLVRFQILNLLLWVSFAFGWGALQPQPWYQPSRDFTDLLVMAGGVSAVLGTGIIWVRAKLGNGETRQAQMTPGAIGAS